VLGIRQSFTASAWAVPATISELLASAHQSKPVKGGSDVEHGGWSSPDPARRRQLKPLSMLTTVTPAAQELVPSRAASPPKAAP
jgi:hypothetical protein